MARFVIAHAALPSALLPALDRGLMACPAIRHGADRKTRMVASTARRPGHGDDDRAFVHAPLRAMTRRGLGPCGGAWVWPHGPRRPHEGAPGKSARPLVEPLASAASAPGPAAPP